MKSLIQLIESEKIKGKNPSTDEIRKVIFKKLNTFRKLEKTSNSKETVRMCKFFIFELETLYNKTFQYDLMENTLKSIKKEEIPDLVF